MKINYKSDFDFLLNVGTCQCLGGNRQMSPQYDFEGTISNGTNQSNVYTFSHKGDEWVNCYQDGDKIHVVVNDHNLQSGKLWLEFKAYIPNDIYPDKDKVVVSAQTLDIELVRTTGDCGCTLTTSLP